MAVNFLIIALLQKKISVVTCGDTYTHFVLLHDNTLSLSHTHTHTHTRKFMAIIHQLHVPYLFCRPTEHDKGCREYSYNSLPRAPRIECSSCSWSVLYVYIACVNIMQLEELRTSTSAIQQFGVITHMGIYLFP